MKPTIALTEVHVDIGQIIFDGFLLIGFQVFDLIMVPLFQKLCPIPRRIFHKLTPRRKDHLEVSVLFVRFLILGAYRDVECGVRVAPGSGPEARWAQLRAWDEPRKLHNGCQTSHRRRFVNAIGDSVMAASGLSQRAARGMRCSCVQQARVARR